MTRLVLSGNYAQSYAARLARVQVISAYPITPQTTIVEQLAKFVSSGELPAQFIKVESEHSALQVCVSAAALGARTYTATSSQGLLLMHELLHWASGMRTPIVMGVVSRSVGPPWSLDADHTDTMSQRDTGWVQIYPESNQEVLDSVLEAFRLAEDLAIRLPVMVAEDAFYLSHTVEPVEVPSQAQVDAFLPPRVPKGTLVPGKATRLGSYVGPADYVRFRREQARAMERVPETLAAIEEDYGRRMGRTYGGLVQEYRTEGADAVLLTMGTASTTARAVVDELRSEGKRVGLARIRVFRPFPAKEVRDLASRVDRLGVMDRSWTFGQMGSAATEVAAAIQSSPRRPRLSSFLAGVGGRDVGTALLREMFRDLLSKEPSGLRWLDMDPPKEVPLHG